VVECRKHLRRLGLILGCQSWIRPEHQTEIVGLLGIATRGEEEKGEEVWSVAFPADWPHGCSVLVVGVEESEHRNWEPEPRGWEDTMKDGESRALEVKTL
jgi:hypothetical protein